MFNIDTRSIIFLISMLSILMSVILLIIRRSFPSSASGLGIWAIGPVLCFLSSILYSAKDKIPDIFSILGGNILLITGSVFFLFGTQIFFGMRATYRFWSGVIFFSILPLYWFLIIQPNYTVRLVLCNILMICIFSNHAFLLFKMKTVNQFANLVGWICLLQMALLSFRMISGLTGYGMQGIFDSSVYQVITIIGYAFCMLLITLGVVLMITERVRSEFEHIATHDSLTGVFMRGYMMEACNQEIYRSKRKGLQMTLMLLDLDYFKKINDTFGHLVGDMVLEDFANRVSLILGIDGKLGRFGGEEFLILLPATSIEKAGIIAKHICQSKTDSNLIPTCTVSIGISELIDEKDTVHSILARADKALYLAKANGRNRVEICQK